MNSSTAPGARGKMVGLGWAFSAVGALAMLGSAAMKLRGGPDFMAEFATFGFPAELLTPLGLLELTLVALYLVPATRVLGAILLAAYLGGAVATHVRLGQSFTPPLLLGVLLWMGIYLRDPKLRALFPFAGRR